MSLRIEDVKAGDELECIDRDTLSKDSAADKAILLLKRIIVTNIYHNDILVSETGNAISEFVVGRDRLKYFKKKEQSQYTFDDLINMSSKAVKDGLFKLIKTDFKSLIVLFDSYHFDADPVLVFHNDKNNHVNCEYIKSLYKEKFTIESESDLTKLRDCKVTLMNGNSFTMKNINMHNNKDRGCLTIEFDSEYGTRDAYGFLELKGATVEQERGRDD